jgi:nitrate reductase (cytochrome), electron transfer subunit
MLKKNTLAVMAILVLAVAMTGCLKNDKDGAPAAGLTEVADTELSYRNEPLMDPSITPADVFDSADAGESKLLGRAFENAPPLIPHSTDDWLPITLSENQCLDCHLPENAADEGATPTPASHLYDIRRGKQLTTLNPANYNCTQCHADQADVDILVENTFEPYFRTDDGEKQSNLLDILNDGVE